MGKPYSLDLREQMCVCVAQGNSMRAAGRLLEVTAAPPFEEPEPRARSSREWAEPDHVASMRMMMQ